ncbi:hypothetical protein EVAR_55829_1 [Eumeta japonica]|uniref:Uncharacterized protein n=1 Tax=Eumeta variegata TaxID=151549 RepID=A0A4C1YXK2_EUMVA|nr:hypothetical protein EVAR_55829_1 [Eumeta japonica]
MKAMSGKKLAGSESWIWQKKNESRINAVEMPSLRSLCGVFQKDRRRYSDVRERCGLKEGVVTRVERGMLRWFDSLERMKESRLTKQIYRANLDQGNLSNLMRPGPTTRASPQMKSTIPLSTRTLINYIILYVHSLQAEAGLPSGVPHGVYSAIVDADSETQRILLVKTCIFHIQYNASRLVVAASATVPSAMLVQTCKLIRLAVFEDNLSMEIPPWIINPFDETEVENVILQEELLELSTNEGRYQKFWLQAKISEKYPRLWGIVQKFLVRVGSRIVQSSVVARPICGLGSGYLFDTMDILSSPFNG